MMSKALSGIARFVGRAFVVLVALGTLGSFFPRIPLLGEVGPILTSQLGPWITILSLAGAAISLRSWRQTGKRRVLFLAGLGAFATVGSAAILARQLAIAQANGAHVDPAQVLFARSQSSPNPPPETVFYSEHDGQKLPLDIYRPTGKRAALAPIFVYVHGGGWGAQTLKQREADYRWFAARGYLAISLEYPLATDTRHTWNVAEPQLACALVWIAANAAHYGGDPSRLALWGESAGGNLVLNLSYRANAGTLQPSCPGTPPQVDATIALYPVVDPARMYRNDNPLIGVFGRMMTVRYTGGTPAQFPDRYRAIASDTHIHAKGPPTMLVVPEADHLVDPLAAYAFAERAEAAGITTRLIRMPYAEHAFDLRSGGLGNQMVRQTMLQFLEAHGLKP
jgi:acetyl esterase